MARIGRNGIVEDGGRIARTRPPGREQTGLAKQALEYDLQDLADKKTVAQLVRIVQDTDPGGPPPSVTYALLMPFEFSVVGSPGVNGGTFNVSWGTQAKNKILVGPISGANAIPTFRLQENPDLPYRSQISIEPTTMGATVTPDASLASQFSMVADQDFTLNPPANALDGQKVTIRITQDGTGGRVMTYHADYRFSLYLTPVFCALTGTAGATDYLGCEFNADANKWDIIAFVPGVQ